MPSITLPRATEPHSTIVEFRDASGLAGYRTAISLHAHTHHSKEIMADVPPYLLRVPVVAPLVRREMRKYQRRHGHPVDFTKGWWTPPLRPQDVLESERAQIRQELGLQAVVSITDHDNVGAGFELHDAHPMAAIPLSFEWTVPYRQGFFHLGIHNLRPESAYAVFRRLSRYTRTAKSISLPALLDEVTGDRRTLVVLNHPLWDLAGVGAADHVALVRRFLTEYGRQIHALELNGYRSWPENRGVVTLARAWQIPTISGGDRHGCAPNSLLNLTTATSFDDFVHEIRQCKRSIVLVMPAYREALVARKLMVAAEAMREYPAHPIGQQHWTERVFYEQRGTVRRLSGNWPTGGPLWVRAAVRAFQLGTRPPLLKALCLLVWLAGAASSETSGPSALLDADDAPQTRTSSNESVT